MRKLSTIISLCSMLLFACSGEDNFGGSADSPSGEVFGGGGGPTVGQGGSLASFSIVRDHLYVIEGRVLKTFSLTNPTAPQLSSTVQVAQNNFGQTLFGYGDWLFVGTTTDLIVYSLENPQNPQFASIWEREVFAGCDPVVVRDDIAYTTIRVTSACEQGSGNETIDVLDVSNPSAPIEMNSIDVTNPFGLGVNENHLFLCRGNLGMQVFDRVDIHNDANAQPIVDQNLTFQGNSIFPEDVIPLSGGLLLTVGAGGLYLLDVNDVQNIKVLSLLPTGS